MAAHIEAPGSHTSSECVGGDYGTCDHSHKECAGVEDNEYVYEIVQGNQGITRFFTGNSVV